ncbi:S-adenosyl-L-methionine-dependent methyltransferase [Lipomyces starkeyi]
MLRGLKLFGTVEIFFTFSLRYSAALPNRWAKVGKPNSINRHIYRGFTASRSIQQPLLRIKSRLKTMADLESQPQFAESTAEVPGPTTASKRFNGELKNSPVPIDLQVENQKAEDGHNAKRVKRRHNRKPKPIVVEKTSPDGYLLYDVMELRESLGLHVDVKTSEDGKSFILEQQPATEFRYTELYIAKLSSTGDGIGVDKLDDGTTEIVVVPYSIPGDLVKAKIYKCLEHYSLADLEAVLSGGDARDDSLVRCKYFTKCAGCQLQMLPYEEQLRHKREVIVRAYKNFCEVSDGVIPAIGDTIGSPLEYGYRTKLTPHFDVPRNSHVPTVTPIGFTQKGRSFVIDIEECPIGTPAINEAYKKERIRVRDNIHSYKRGATLLLRESLEMDETTNETKKSVCVDSKDTVTEYVNRYRFKYPAGDFFQCNSSVLPRVTEYVNSQLKLRVFNNEYEPLPAPKYLVDAYCGSGLFSITCNESVEEVIGVEISPKSVACATSNAQDNNIANAEFVLGDAAVIFMKIRTPSNETSMILDPPRKGCDNNFLNQLLDYLPRRIVYVSCNVHTQARDLGYILNDRRGLKYHVNSIRGFDFFPQTHHVESVAVLTLQD